MFNQILFWSPIVLSAVLVVYIALTIQRKPQKWGTSLAIVWVIGLLICLLAALRDGYGFGESAVLSFTGFSAKLLSSLGLAMTGLTLFALINKNQVFRQKAFLIVSLVFVAKLIIMEAIRFLA